MLNIIEEYVDNTISLVASESLLYPQIRQALASSSHQLTVEGTVGNRYFPVPNELDVLEREAKSIFCDIFGFDFCDIRSTTATHANIAVFNSILDYGDTILSLDIQSGGHVSHGHKHSFARKFFNILNYTIEPDGNVDTKKLKNLIIKHKPKFIISGGSSCPREINHSVIADIAHDNNAFHLADVSHSAGLIAAKIVNNTLLKSDFVTFGTQKTFLGPRGGVILSKTKFSNALEKAIFPGTEGAMLIPQVIAKKLAADFALTKNFMNVQERIVKFSKILSHYLIYNNIKVVTGGSDNHIVLIEIENANAIVRNLNKIGLRCNLNPIPNSRKWGIRFGTTSLAQAIICEQDVSELFNNLSNYILNLEDKYLIALKNNINIIVSNRNHLLPTIQNGNFTNQDIEHERELTTKSTLINNPIDKVSKFAEVIKYNSSSSHFSTSEDIGVIIPTLGNDESLEGIIQYYYHRLNNAKIIIVDASFPNDRLVTKVKDNVYKVSLPYFICNIVNIKKLVKDFELNIETNLGKGLSMMLGYLILWRNKIPNAYFMDADLSNIEEYKPLEKLLFANYHNEHVCHSIIATPNRRNEVIHGVLNALEYKNQELIGKMKKYIHFLAGERSLKVNKYLDMPWLTNYGIETWINIFSASRNYNTIQVGNLSRMDGVNSYVKNESMLMYCSKLISLIINSDVIHNNSIDSIRTFNSFLKTINVISILPNKADVSVQGYKINQDCMLPSAVDLFSSNYLCCSCSDFILTSE